MPDRIFLTGGSGFVGQAVLTELLNRGYEVAALTARRPIAAADPRIHPANGNLLDKASLERALSCCSAVIHLVGIIREKSSQGITLHNIHVNGTRNLVEAAIRAGVARFIHMSALGARPDAVSAYHQTKFAAEQIVQNSGLRWTIFRPSLIHGPAGELMQMETAWARQRAFPYLFMPYFASGILGRKAVGRVQPIYVGDVARAFVDALANNRTINHTYEIGGPEKMTWPEFHRAVAKLITGKPRLTLPLPAWYARLLTHIVPASLLPFTGDQVIMSLEDNTCDVSDFINSFGWPPRSLAETTAA